MRTPASAHAASAASTLALPTTGASITTNALAGAERREHVGELGDHAVAEAELDGQLRVERRDVGRAHGARASRAKETGSPGV